MGKILIISEKPKVTKALLVSNRFRNSVKTSGKEPFYGYFENDRYINTWAIGHLLEVFNPEDHDPKRKDFDFEHLPNIFPLKHKPVEKVKEQLEIIKKLILRPDVDLIINACDIDKEGEIIFREIYDYSGTNKPVQRLLLASYEPEEIEVAFNNLESGENFNSVAASGRSRQYLDHLLGDTITRSSTIKFAKKNFLLSGGRVQLCLLSEIRNREQMYDNFKSQTFYNLIVDTGFLSMLVSEEQLLDPRPLNELMERLKNVSLTVKDYTEKESKRNPKNLYNLTDLYKDCITKLNIPSPKAKKAIQNLYEEGYITYPRSDSRNLPTTMVDTVKATIKSLQSASAFSQLASLINDANVNVKHRSFNDELVTAHYAIVPTKKVLPNDRPELEKHIYDLIVKRFISNWLDPAIFEVREVILTDQEDNQYKASEKILKVKGFLEVTKEEHEEDEIKESFSIPTLSKNEILPVRSTYLKPGQTRRPSLHTEASILTFMETAGRNLLEDEELKELMKGKRIGTVATEETFIPKLLKRGYIFIEKGKIRTTSLGASFIDAFPVEQIKDPTFTAEMEHKIHLIQEGIYKYEEFVSFADELAHTIVERMSKVTDRTIQLINQSRQEDIELCKCKCGGTIISKGKLFGCTNHPECNISIPQKIKGKSLTGTQIEKLINNGKTELIKGFKGEEKTFDAFVLLEDGKLKFGFPTLDDISLGACPRCKTGTIIPKKSNYGCSEYKNGCQYSLPMTLKEKKISEGQVKKLLSSGKTDFINGFIGAKGEYTAALSLKENGEFEFIFPTVEDRTVGKCPLCRSRVLVGKSYYLCEEYKKSCDFILGSVFLKKQIPQSQIIKLLEKNITDTIKGFESSNTGKTFDAKLSYDKTEKRLKLIFNMYFAIKKYKEMQVKVQSLATLAS